mgnify:CR=1 FL=1
MRIMTREEAWNIVCEFIQSDALRRHSLAVEACVTAYARHFAAAGQPVEAAAQLAQQHVRLALGRERTDHGVGSDEHPAQGVTK